MTVRRTDVSGAPPETALFAALRAAVPTGGRRGASQRCRPEVLPRCLTVRRKSGLRCSLRFAQRCRPEVGVPVLARRLCSIGTALFAALRAAVPTGGRRSLAGASLVLNRDCAVRCASRSGADRRSAFPCRRVACAQPGLRCSLRFAQRCRPEVGVPLLAVACAQPGLRCSLRFAQRCRPGRRSLAGALCACAAVPTHRDCAVRCASRSGADRRSAFPCRRVACAQPGLRCSLRFARGADRRSAFPCRVACSIGALFVRSRSGADRRSAFGRRVRRLCSMAFPCRRVACAQDCAVRCASRSGADRRSAFPCRRVACAQCGTAPLAPRRGAVPTGGRRSLAGASLVQPGPLLARRSAW